VGANLTFLTDPEGRFTVDSESVSKIAQHCNTKKAAAKQAQEASQHLYLCTLISDLTQKYGPVRRQASVVSVLDQAFDVVVSDFGIEKRVHVDQMPIEVSFVAYVPYHSSSNSVSQNHVHDERSNILQLYWKKGVDVIKFLAENSGDPHLQRIKETAEQHARLMEASSRSNDAEKALFEDDEEESSAAQVPEVANASASKQKQKSLKKDAPVFEGVEENASGHCVQTVKELQTVPVIVSADLTVCPPVIK
jgi:protein SSD1